MKVDHSEVLVLRFPLFAIIAAFMEIDRLEIKGYTRVVVLEFHKRWI